MVREEQSRNALLSRPLVCDEHTVWLIITTTRWDTEANSHDFNFSNSEN